jgi:predicted nucleic acid-binding protein
MIFLQNHGDGGLSIQVMQEFFVTVTQKVPNPMDNATAIEVIRSLRFWNVHEPSIDDIINATDTQIRYQVSFWDAVILQSALQLKCDLLWSEDLNPGQVYQGINIINPLQ